MPNEILNIQHTINQLQNVEKLQAAGQQREQYQQKQEAVHLQAKRELEQTIVQISEDAEKVFLKEEGEKDGKDRKGREGSHPEPEGRNREIPDTDTKLVDIVI